ncbi:MAG: DUF2254 domain-containing protein [Gemmatimonadaceae bacterium]
MLFILRYWNGIRSSFWFVPAAMALGAVLLAFGTVALDRSGAGGLLENVGWIYSGGAEGASAVLGTVASSMMTVTGLVFSMTLLTLSLASSQFGPRLLRNFMRDTANQLVLGTFVATFIYCLLVLRTIRRADEIAFVPHLSVTLGVAFALASLGVLIYFIHHISISIQADEIIARVGDDLIHGIDREFPETDEGETRNSTVVMSEGDIPPGFEDDGRPIEPRREGYLQFSDLGELIDIAARHDMVLRLERRPGQYVFAGRPIVLAWPGSRVTPDVTADIVSAFNLGNSRTPWQDIEYSVNQLVEIAVRALSPGVNDPFTAVTCVDRLGSGLHRLAQREVPSRFRLDDKGNLRLILPAVTFGDIMDAAFNEIRRNSRSTASVSIRLLDTLAVIASAVTTSADHESVLRHAEMIERGARASLHEEADMQVVEDRFRIVRDVLIRADGLKPDPRRARESLASTAHS